MASLLIIETGEGVDGANSYASATDAKAYAQLRNLSLPVADEDIEKKLILAMDYLESLRNEYKGRKTAGTNSLQWPREGVAIDGFDLATDEIPDILLKAQCQLAVDATTFGELEPVGTGREVVSEKVEGAVEVRYAQLGITNLQPIYTKARNMLAPLLDSGADSGFGLDCIRA